MDGGVSIWLEKIRLTNYGGRELECKPMCTISESCLLMQMIRHTIGFSTSIFVEGTHLCRERSEQIFSVPPTGRDNKLICPPHRERPKYVCLIRGGGMHLYLSQGRKKHCFPKLRDRVIKYIIVVYNGHTCLFCPYLRK